MLKIDVLLKSPKTLFSVIPAEAGIQSLQGLLDSRLRGSDDLRDFLRLHQSYETQEYSRLRPFDELRATSGQGRPQTEYRMR
jgi:hypothetical protein